MNNKPRHSKEEAYWLNQLSGDWRRSNFPYDRAPVKTVGPGNENIEGSPAFRLSAEMFSLLMKLSGHSLLRLHMILTAGVVSLLSRYTGNKDIIVGTSIYKQQREGEFINTVLTLRNRFTDATTFKELLLQVRTTITGAVENQNYPVEMLVQKLGIPFYKGDDFPLFDVLVLLENIQDKSYIRRIKCGMLFLFSNAGEEVKGMVEYHASRYDKETIGRVSIHFENLLRGALRNVDTPIGHIDILTREEKKGLLYDVNRTGAKNPVDKTIHRLFADQVAKTPDNISAAGPSALKYRANMSYRTYISYRELNERSHGLARVLIEKGIKADTIVGMMVEHSIEMMIGLLGILKAGAAYLPIDPDYPQERIDFMLKDSSASILLAEDTENTGEACSCPSRLLPFYPSTLPASSLSTLTSTSTCQVSPANLAYVIYTSGSTGKPKGVMVAHRNVVNYIAWAIKTYVKNERIDFPLYTSLSFDLTVTSIFVPLLTGNKVILYGGEYQGLLLEEILAENRVNAVKITPSHMKLIKDRKAGAPGSDSLKRFIVGGEELDMELARAIDGNFAGKVEIYNEYGPTETTVGSIIYKFDPGKDKGKSVPIGIPIDNTAIYILDRNMQPVPTGVIGEIYISGSGVARGYLNRPRLTAEKFIDNPFLPGQNMYITGDLARWIPGGNIEYSGRIDSQVKIKGYRVEPGEIESLLLKNGAIQEAVVRVTEDENGEKSLGAYVVSNHSPDEYELKKYLSQYLASYMVPSYIMQIERIPLTRNGKLDTAALPKPAAAPGPGHVAPRAQLEKQLAGIWEIVLGREGIGIQDNFFVIGGDSIKTIQVAARLKELGYSVTMKEIFENPTIAELAAVIKTPGKNIDQAPVTGEIPLTPIQAEFFAFPLQNHAHFNMWRVIYAGNRFEEDMLGSIFKKLQDHHDALRMTYRKKNGRVVQENHGPDYPGWFKVYDYRNRTDADTVMKEKLDEIHRGMDLEKGPLMKCALFHLDEGDRLVIIIHHLVIDGVSWRILFEDFGRLYRQYQKGVPFKLPLKTESFKHWAEKLAEYANSESFLKEKNDWARVESAGVPVIKPDFQDPGHDICARPSLWFRLSKAQTGLLLTTVNKAFKTDINDILLTALGLGLKKTFGHSRFAVALEGHGREEIFKDFDLYRTVGWFTAVYPVVLDISFDNDPGYQLIKIKETLRRVPNRGIGYGILAYLTAGENKKDLAFNLKPQVGFNYLGQLETEASGMPAGLKYGSIELSLEPGGQSKYDFDIYGVLEHDQLTMSITYNPKQYKPAAAERLRDNFKLELDHIISYCSARENVQLTPWDLTYKELSIDTVRKLSARYPLIDVYPLSPMQEGILFHTLYDDSPFIYLGQMTFRFHEELNIEWVEKSINQLFIRHDVMRTVFIYEEESERMLQLVLQERRVDFLYRDLRPVTDRNERENQVKEAIEKDKRRPFDLNRDVLMRVVILQLEDNEYHFIWTHHHIMMDGWCLSVIISEYLEIYNSYLLNRPFHLPGTAPYKKYIDWLGKQDYEKSRRSWEKYLEGYDQPSNIPKLKTPAANNEPIQNERIFFSIDSEKTGRLVKLAGENQVTLNMVINTIWGILLGNYSDKKDVVFGVVVSGRPSEIEGIESMIGVFINTIALRIRYNDHTRFIDLLEKTQREAVESAPYHYISLADIHGVSILKQKLFDHIIVFENYPREEITLNISAVEHFSPNNYDLTLVVWPGEQITFLMEYNPRVYSATLMNRVKVHIEEIMDQVIDNPARPLKDISIAHVLPDLKTNIFREDHGEFDF